MLAFEVTIAGVMWTLFIAWAVWMCVVILRFALSGGSKSWR
jgi:hypothetical protein